MTLPTPSPFPNVSRSPQNVLTTVQRTMAEGVRAIGFWLAIVVPFLYLPLLVDGIGSPSEMEPFVGLLVLNVLALVGGHGHRR